MRRIDSHQHFWHYDAARLDWINERMGALKRDFLPADLEREMAAIGFDGSVLVQVEHSLAETRWLLELADQHDFILGVVGWVDLRSPTVAAELEDLSQHPKLVGIRHIVQNEPDGFLLGQDFLRGVAHIARFRLTYDVLIYARQLPEAVDFVSRFPNQSFVLDHIAKPDIAHGHITDWRWHMRALSRFPNVVCKLSGMVTEADWAHWTPADIQPYLDVAIECFGPERLMIGSDWPVCTVAATYAQTMALVTDVVSTWSAAERDAVLGGTAARVWGLVDRRSPGPFR